MVPFEPESTTLFWAGMADLGCEIRGRAFRRLGAEFELLIPIEVASTWKALEAQNDEKSPAGYYWN